MATLLRVDQGFIDHSGERSKTSYYLAGGNSNIIASAQLSAADAVHDGMAAVTLCNFTTQWVVYEEQSDTPIIPSNDYAQREVALLVEYADIVTDKVFSLSIPGPDLTLFAQANTDEVDISSNLAALTLISILEGNLVTRDDNSIVVKRMRIIGRRN